VAFFGRVESQGDTTAATSSYIAGARYRLAF